MAKQNLLICSIYRKVLIIAVRITASQLCIRNPWYERCLLTDLQRTHWLIVFHLFRPGMCSYFVEERPLPSDSLCSLWGNLFAHLFGVEFFVCNVGPLLQDPWPGLGPKGQVPPRPSCHSVRGHHVQQAQDRQPAAGTAGVRDCDGSCQHADQIQGQLCISVSRPMFFHCE